MSDLGVLGSSSNGTINSPPTSPNLGNNNIGIEISSPFQTNNDTNVGQTSSHNNYRHSRAYRHFKNPPQPHMCIRTTTIMGDELFINVLSWTRIVIPQEPSDPIPLYGGMRVPPGSPRCPPLVYAVMANPEVLKDSGRHSKDPEERRAMVELMCDFVEAMNTDVKLTRNAVILKDRDISGELKDVWNAVQAQRDREREEQITQQQRQQQQHYHNVTTQQMFPKVISQQQQLEQQQYQQDSLQYFQTETIYSSSQESQHNTTGTNELSVTDNNSHKNEICGSDNKILYMDFDPEISTQATSNILHSNQNLNDEINEMKLNELQKTNSNQINEMVAQSAINSLANINFTFNNIDNNDKLSNNINISNNIDNCINNENVNVDIIDTTAKTLLENQLNKSNIPITTATTTQTINPTINNKVNINNDITKSIISNSEIKTKTNQSNNITANNNSSTIIISTNAPTSLINSTINTTTSTTTISTTQTTTTTPTIQTTTKKEKLGGFLPNGCIFPRFKNNKHKEKDKDKDNTKTSSNKEKTLLNSLKKVTSPSNKSHQQQQQHQENKSQQYEKNCINLENEVEKLDLNKLDSTGSNDMVIKVKVASSGAK